MFDARHVDVRHTTGPSDMSYVVCRMSMSRICLHYPNTEDMPNVTSVDKIVEVKRVSLV
jgi:hypothetical protein